MNGTEQNRTGSKHPNIAPYGDLLKLNGGRHIVLAVGSDAQFSKLCSVLDTPELIGDPNLKQPQKGRTEKLDGERVSKHNC